MRLDELMSSTTSGRQERVWSLADPEVYATVTDLGGGLLALAVHVAGEHPRVPEATILGRTEATDRDAVIRRAGRAVVEQARDRAIERGALVREVVPHQVARDAGLAFGWPDATADDARRTHRVVQEWADERLEELDARYYDVTRLGHDIVVWFTRDDGTVPAGDPRWAALDNGSGEVARAFGARRCPACGHPTRPSQGVLADHHAPNGGGECPASGSRITGESPTHWTVTS